MIFLILKTQVKSEKVSGPSQPELSKQKLYDMFGCIDSVPPSVPIKPGFGKLFVLEDNDAVIKMTVKQRSPMTRHVSRTHRVDLDWLFERISKDSY